MEEKIGIIGGTSLKGIEFKGKKELVRTPFGKVELLKVKNAFLIQRHGENTPPHRINHKANLKALKEKGVKNIIGIGSTGSLKKEIEPPSLVIPHDYMNFGKILTFYDEKIKHITPGLDEKLREKLREICEKTDLKVHYGGVYFQTHGPRFETPAEIRFLGQHADIVGMTLASEATLAKELGLNYASVCTVDNHGNGLTEEPLSYEMIRKNIRKNHEQVKRIVKELIK